ncbi:ArgR family transcriptional regulator [Candidatus Oleimmundimicrobium sp.]|uniref:arginine repressor n=1 Tax=Candidatus Oleimmundimicrobium sp. TaxID=3060597 RepID=UPI0027232FAA|nr:ArgR family transcriptional regulator [Candidatus Oleimmundimicrobium sp.]MDO8886116.1 ArgR family transcriptional regulator [Candidatus Oleimmundimicrobium sp.]
MEKKKARQADIKKLVREQKIKTQEEIMLGLKKKGFKTTQATISRDISDLGLDKNEKGYYVLAKDMYLIRMMKEFVNNIVSANNLVLIKCAAGSAPGVAAALDEIDWEEILGTIAGDDTILMVVSDDMVAKLIEKRLIKLKTG